MFLQTSNRIIYKTPQEIDLIRASGDLLGRVHGEISKNIKEGIETKKLDTIAFEFIMDHGAVPSFLNYRGYSATLCVSVNQTVVHGIPNKYVLREGDIVSVDCGVFLNGYHADSAYTYQVGVVSEDKKRLLKITYQSLLLGIQQAKVGFRTGDIGFAVQNFVEKAGYSVVRELVGHGVGKHLHEGPEIPNFGKRGKGQKLANGMVLAIEPMINMGKKDVYQLDDGWTVNTLDNLPSAHFEHTVAICGNDPQVLTTFDYIIKEQRIDG